MRIDHQMLTGVSAPARTAAAAQRWVVGQLLSIGVIGRVDETSIRLAIDGREVLARTSLDLAPGTRLTARVLSAGAQPLLGIVDPQPSRAPSAGAAAATATTIRAALVGTLPVQSPLNAVLTQLEAQATANTAPAAVQTRVLNLTQALPDLPALAQPAALARAVANAGHGLEATLGAALEASADAPSGAPATDLKFQLLGLRETIDRELAQTPRLATPPQGGAGPRGAAAAPELERATAQSALRALAQEVDAGVARITTHQLQHLAAADRGDFYAYAELPFRTAAGVDTLTLSIDADDRPAQGREDGAAGRGSIALDLAVPLADLGELRARIGLAGERLAVTLWSEEPALRELIVEDIGGLEDRLAALGFELTPIALREVPAADPLRDLPQRLIDTSI
ncbi:MAG TPA: flagellar hook-length control protein FliK [Gammaproteobacteria bacterium]|nr:flagellar hook-length control protein FliK [Gammaproteobacteria bacterium]